MNERFDFASDNVVGLCPEAWEVLREIDADVVPSYGADCHTARACEQFRQFFEADCEVFFVFNGTAANSLALAALCQPYHSIITHEAAHIQTDECGAPEFFSNGTKLLLGSGEDGRLSPKSVEALLARRNDIHFPRPRVVSVSQPTELGTCYTVEQVRELCDLAKRHELKVHMDGARFFHALVSSGAEPKELTWKAGVDVLCFGGTKAGLGFSEAVVFFDRDLAKEFAYRRKQAGQLASKMRYLSAPWIKWLREGVYKAHSKNAIDQAKFLASEASKLPEVKILCPVEANSVFMNLGPTVSSRLQEGGWKYFHFIGGGARFMCSWKTERQQVEHLLEDMAS